LQVRVAKLAGLSISIASLGKLAVSNRSLRSLRCSLGSRRLRQIRRNHCGGESALFRWFRRLLLQIGAANIAGADRALEHAYFVVAPGRKACPLTPPQHGAWHDPVRLPRSASSLYL